MLYPVSGREDETVEDTLESDGSEFKGGLFHRLAGYQCQVL